MCHAMFNHWKQVTSVGRSKASVCIQCDSSTKQHLVLGCYFGWFNLNALYFNERLKVLWGTMEKLLCDDKCCRSKLMGHMGKSDREKHMINVLISEDGLWEYPWARHFISDYRSCSAAKVGLCFSLDTSWLWNSTDKHFIRCWYMCFAEKKWF